MADSKLRRDEKSFDVEIKRWENESLKIKVWMVRVGKEYWFFGKEFASALGYADPRRAIQDRITDPEEKKSMEEILGRNYRKILEQSLVSTEGKIPSVDFFQRVKNSQKLVTELALYHFCATSKKEKARPFQKWIFDTIRKIRETGSYTLPGGAASNPLDLIAKVSAFKKETQDLKKEIQTLRSCKKETCDRGTQTQDIENVKDSFKRLRNKVEKSIREVESRLRESLGETSFSRSSSSYSSSSSRRSSSSE